MPDIGTSLPVWSAVPFAGMLLALGALLVVPAERPDWDAGEWAGVLPRRAA